MLQLSVVKLIHQEISNVMLHHLINQYTYITYKVLGSYLLSIH